MRSLSFLILLLLAYATYGQVVLKGSIRDSDGQQLPQAHLFIHPDSITTTSGNDGKFSIRLRAGRKTLQVTYVGYKILQQEFVITRDSTVHVVMTPDVNELREIVVTGQRDFQHEIFDNNRTSTHVLTQDDINSIPVLGGEADVIKTLQLLPGTVRGVEGTSDLFVRGGAADQNLVLLDGAPIYNTSHLFGFLSVFNPDILHKVEAINGGFPAEYGGRLSSILDVESKVLMPDKTKISGDIGLIASRLMIEQPLVNDKLSLWVAGRRTYVDQVVRAIGEELPYFFYDLNAKLIFKPSKRDNVELSYYGGEDVLDLFRDRNNDGDGFLTRFTSGNSSQSLQWTKSLKNNRSTQLSLYRTSYRYDIRNSFEENELAALSNIEDYGVSAIIRMDSVAFGGAIQGGVSWVRHSVSPSVINTVGSFAEFLESSSTTGKVADELAVHAQYEWSPVERWQLNAGLRVSGSFTSGKFYSIPEPRLSARYKLSPNEALKFSYSRMAQYIHRISNSAVTAPTDIWYPVTDSIRPQASHQVAIAWQRTVPGMNIFVSVEGYYKAMKDLIGYEEGTNLFFNNDFESKLIQGRGRAYGLEFLLRKDAGKLTGWLSYTLSWSWRRFDEIDPEWFPARYDRRHNGALVLQYAVKKRWAISAVWEYISGSKFTPVIGQYVVSAPSLTGVELIPLYSEINGVKLADSHRLDLGIKFRSKPGRKFQWHWFAGVYNVYNRASPVGINIEQDETDGSLRYTQPGLFGTLPFISYGFKL
jgi:outer membrane cobalamin receptor